MRQVGKQAVLGLGVGIGTWKFMNTLRADPGAARLFDTGELSPAICRDIVDAFRGEYPLICQFWSQLDWAARAAVGQGWPTISAVHVTTHGSVVLVWLPSGRALRFENLRLDFTPREIVYLDSNGRPASFSPEEPSLMYGTGSVLYGGKLCENIVQATACDILVDAVLALERQSLPVLFHVHDEVIVEVPEAEARTGEGRGAGRVEPDASVGPWAAGRMRGPRGQFLQEMIGQPSQCQARPSRRAKFCCGRRARNKQSQPQQVWP